MTLPVNLAAIEQRAAQRQTSIQVAKQNAAKARFTENVERGFNPEAANREAGRREKFSSLQSRRRPTETAETKIKEVKAKSEEDLAGGYQRRNPELPADRLRALKAAIHPDNTPEEILNEAQEAFSDPTLADEALEYLEKGAEGGLKERVTQARALLIATKGRAVIAGRNVDAAAKSFHKKGVGSSPTDLRNLYRDITESPERDHNTLFADLARRYPFDQLKLVVAFLLKGLGYDLKSKGPSIQAQELMRLMTETRNLQSILWIYLFFKGRMGMIRSLFDQYGFSLSEALGFEKLAREFIRLVEERYPSALKLLKQTDKLGLLDDLEKIIVLSQFRDAIRALSPRLYKSMRHRQDLLLVILETLEELEEREAEREESES